MKAEYRKGCLQRDSVERKGYVGAQSVAARDNKERDNATGKKKKTRKGRLLCVSRQLRV